MTFLQKYELLKKSVPVPSLLIRSETVDSAYVDVTFFSKNCYYCFEGHKLVDCMYTTMGAWGNKLVDCTYVTESEKCYKCIDSNKCHNSTYLMDCNNCTDCHFSAFLNSCSDCFGCVALSHKNFCIFNKQYTKVEYYKAVEKLKKEKPEKILDKLLALKRETPHPASQQFSNENCPYGDYIYNSKNSYWCFNSYYVENSGYHYVSAHARNCWDIFFSGGDPTLKSIAENCYEIMDSINCYNCAFLQNCPDCMNCFYGVNLKSCIDCFGCVGLTKKKYCVLNNQLSKVEYEKAVRSIKIELGWRVLMTTGYESSFASSNIAESLVNQ